MRFSLFLLPVAALLVSCTDFEVPDTASAPVAPEKTKITRSASQGEAALRRVARKVEPVAERMCRQERAPKNPIECDFLITIDRKAAKVPNAYQTLQRGTNRPIIAFNIPMLRTIQNDHEIAFILGHEAGHQIGAHIAKTRTSAHAGCSDSRRVIQAAGGNSAAVQNAQKIGGSFAARAYSKDYELEADVVGTYVAEAAGYNPVIGARSFARFGGGSNSFLSTHPPSGNRIATVNAAAAEIRRQRALGQTPATASSLGLMDNRFFGYGSLVNGATHDYAEMAPAKLNGWRRRWSHRVKREDLQVSSLTVIPSPGTVIAGATARVPGGDWQALDAREIGYERLVLGPTALAPASDNVSMYKSLNANDHPGNAEFPILQSYLDCVLQGFLRMHGADAPAAFIATTDGWDTPILQDRAKPIYPRAVSLSQEEMVLFDTLLETMPKTHL